MSYGFLVSAVLFKFAMYTIVLLCTFCQLFDCTTAHAHKYRMGELMIRLRVPESAHGYINERAHGHIN